MANKTVKLCSVSWIDGRSLPPVGLTFFVGAKFDWTKRTLMGLVGTSNPAPPPSIGNVATFRQTQEFRALMSCAVGGEHGRTVSDKVLDPGWTPPLNKAKFAHNALVQFAADKALPNDPNYYAGEASVLSDVVGGRLHPSSTLKVAHGAEVLVSALIKFRAGPHTNAIGVSKDGAQSPFHVPWVWCEYALVRIPGKQLRLLGAGSAFPSHRWYVNGEMVGECLQRPVIASEKDPVLNSGQPAGQIQSKAETDQSPGAVHSHANAMGPCAGIDIALSLTLLNV